MAATKLRLQRSVALHVQIEKYLLDQIRRGALQIGDKLPSASDLAAQLDVHEVTVQKALRRLKVAGILHRTPRVGTFVRSSPQRAQIGIFFGPNLSEESSHFYRAVSRSLEALTHHRKQKCRIYDNLNAAANETELAALPSYQHYLADRGNSGFRGMILIGCDVKWVDFFKKSPYPPCVAGSDGGGPGTDVCFDRSETIYDGVSYFASRGKRRLLYLRTMSVQVDMEGLGRALEDHHFDDVQIEHLAMHKENHYQEAVAYERVCALAKQWNKSGKFPDSILVSDDIAMRGIALALVRHRIMVPEVVEVLACTNEGITHHYGLPITKYEVSPRQFASKLFDVLCAHMDGAPASKLPCKIKGRILAGNDEVKRKRGPVRKPGPAAKGS